MIVRYIDAFGQERWHDVYELTCLGEVTEVERQAGAWDIRVQNLSGEIVAFYSSVRPDIGDRFYHGWQWRPSPVGGASRLVEIAARDVDIR